MNIEKYLADFQLIGNNIRRLRIENNFIELDMRDENLRKQIDVEYDIDDMDYSEEDKEAYGVITLYVSMKISQRDNENKKCDVNLALQGAFVLHHESDKNVLKDLLSVNGCASLFSIARAIIQTTTSQTFALGSITIPMINVFQLKEDKDKLESEETEKDDD